MPKETLTEKIEKAKKERTAEMQKIYQEGFKEGEKRCILEFQEILRTLHDHTLHPLKAFEDLEWVRWEIENQLGIYNERLVNL